MMGYACSEKAVLPVAGEHDTFQKKSSRLSRDSDLLRRMHFLDDIWHEKLISQNLRLALVDNIAMLYVNRGVALPELIREGNQGLTHALENFEFEGGSRFSSYAARCIRQCMERAITSHSGAEGVSEISEDLPQQVSAATRVQRKNMLSRGAKAQQQSI